MRIAVNSIDLTSADLTGIAPMRTSPAIGLCSLKHYNINIDQDINKFLQCSDIVSQKVDDGRHSTHRRLRHSNRCQPSASVVLRRSCTDRFRVHQFSLIPFLPSRSLARQLAGPSAVSRSRLRHHFRSPVIQSARPRRTRPPIYPLVFRSARLAARPRNYPSGLFARTFSRPSLPRVDRSVDNNELSSASNCQSKRQLRNNLKLANPVRRNAARSGAALSCVTLRCATRCARRGSGGS